jgi:hypothetical protein
MAKNNEISVNVFLPKVLKRELNRYASGTGMKIKAVVAKALTE